MACFCFEVVLALSTESKNSYKLSSANDNTDYLSTNFELTSVHDSNHSDVEFNRLRINMDNFGELSKVQFDDDCISNKAMQSTNKNRAVFNKLNLRNRFHKIEKYYESPSGHFLSITSNSFTLNNFQYYQFQDNDYSLSKPSLFLHHVFNSNIG